MADDVPAVRRAVEETERVLHRAAHYDLTLRDAVGDRLRHEPSRLERTGEAEQVVGRVGAAAEAERASRAAVAAADPLGAARLDAERIVLGEARIAERRGRIRQA